jgi:hypothetical protein
MNFFLRPVHFKFFYSVLQLLSFLIVDLTVLQYILRGFFHTAVARVHLAQMECLKFAVEIHVAANELCHVVVGSYSAVLKSVFDPMEVIEGRPTLGLAFQ